ncbi:MAG: LacI family DNA-binding transcriptional regulator [Sphaerochaetaceae bacterium]|nr:LacI family DNA-binding transcriptional regulator [Sphaerochaetaceae bacterium]
MVNIYDISEKAGVSIATVSRVLNGSKNVSEKTRQKVQDVIEKESFVPNALARGLSNSTMKTIGILCPDASDLFFSSAIDSIERNLRRNGYNCLLCCSGNYLDDKKESLLLLNNKKVDAIILIGSSYMEQKPSQTQYIFQVAESVPIVTINSHFEHPNIYCVENDPFESVYNITKKMIEAGKKKPLFLFQGQNYSCIEKQKGFVKAIEESDLSIKPELMQCSFGIAEATKSIIEQAKNLSCGNPDVVICSHDELAVAFLKYSKKIGLDVPGQCNLIGHGDLMFAECCEPELTTININVSELCNLAVQKVIALINGEKPSHSTIIIGELHERYSTDEGLFEK